MRLAGEHILIRSVRTVASAGVDSLIVVADPERIAETEALLADAALPRSVVVVAGGATRNESTWNGLQALHAADDDTILVHDAVRPLVPLEVIQRAIAPVVSDAADSTDTVIASADTLVIVDGDRIAEIPDRSRYRRGQTPQVFRKEVLQRAHVAARAAGDPGTTDDCSLVLRHVPGVRIVAVAGDEINLKVTTQIDLVLADRLLQMRTFEPAAHASATRSLRGARILVIGGTNGIGQAIAEAATLAGARVEVDGRSLGLDVRDPELVERRIDAAAARLGGLDDVVVTAGILMVGAVADARASDLTEVIDVNVAGTLHVARAAHRHLRESRGSLTVFASSSFTRGRPDFVAYSASKAAIVNLAQGLAEEWSPDRIRVNAISPERTDTPMRRRAFPDEPTAGLLSADEVAVATLQLLGSDLTGQVVDVRRHAGPLAVPGHPSGGARVAASSAPEPEPDALDRERVAEA